MRPVRILHDSQTGSVGSLADAVIGSVADSSAGSGHGQALMTLGDMLFGSIIVRNARNPALTRKALQAILKTEKGRTISIVQPLGVKLQAGEKNLDHALQHPLRQALSRGTAAVPRDGTQHLLKHAYRVTRPSR